MIKKLSSVLAISSLMALPMSQVLAVDSPWSVGAAIGSTKLKSDCGAGNVCDFSDTGYKIYGGYSLNQNFAVELSYVDLGEGKLSATGVSVAGDKLSISSKISGLAASVVGTYPIEKLSLFAKAGFANLSADTTGTYTFLTTVQSKSQSVSNTDFTFGVGAAYSVTENVGVHLALERFKTKEKLDALSTLGVNTESNDDLDLVSLGVSYRF